MINNIIHHLVKLNKIINCLVVADLRVPFIGHKKNIILIYSL
jgi:hypothetical protein